MRGRERGSRKYGERQVTRKEKGQRKGVRRKGE